MLANKFKINFFEFSKLFKVSFDFEDSSKYTKLTGVIYFKIPDNYGKNHAKNRKIAKITQFIVNLGDFLNLGKSDDKNNKQGPVIGNQ